MDNFKRSLAQQASWNSTGVGHGTSIREVYFFGPKSILFLLKYAQIYFFVAIEDITTEFWAKFGISRKIIAGVNKKQEQAGAE